MNNSTNLYRENNMNNNNNNKKVYREKTYKKVSHFDLHLIKVGV